jgi:hypothetical protein
VNLDKPISSFQVPLGSVLNEPQRRPPFVGAPDKTQNTSTRRTADGSSWPKALASSDCRRPFWRRAARTFRSSLSSSPPASVGSAPSS